MFTGHGRNDRVLELIAAMHLGQQQFASRLFYWSDVNSLRVISERRANSEGFEGTCARDCGVLFSPCTDAFG